MFDWLGAAPPAEGDLPVETLAARLLVAAGVGVVVAAVYFLTQRKPRAEAAPLVATLVLLAVLLAMVTLVIGGNAARAFGLAGVLSIVRFRTVVEDTRDTAFVIFAVVAGMAVGAGLLAVAFVGVPVVAAEGVLLSVWARSRGPASAARAAGTLVVRLGIGANPDAALAEVLARHLDGVRLLAAATARAGAALDLTYTGALGGGAAALVAELNRVEGVQGVEWKDGAGETK